MSNRRFQATASEASSRQVVGAHEVLALSKDFDVIEGFQPREGAIYNTTRAISSRVNQNFDGFSAGELKKAYRSFLGKPCFVNHENSDPSVRRGRVVGSRFVENGNDKYIEVIQEVYADKYPKLAKEILEGGLDSVSMGCEAKIAECSFCGNLSTGFGDMCDHIKFFKGHYLPRVNAKTGKAEEVLIYENCKDLGFFELSYVFEPADETAVVSNVIVANKNPKGVSMTDHERWVKRSQIRKESYGEVEAPAKVNTLRQEDDSDFDDYHHWVESPEEFQTPDFDQTKRIDRETEDDQNDGESTAVDGLDELDQGVTYEDDPFADEDDFKENPSMSRVQSKRRVAYTEWYPGPRDSFSTYNGPEDSIEGTPIATVSERHGQYKWTVDDGLDFFEEGTASSLEEAKSAAEAVLSQAPTTQPGFAPSTETKDVVDQFLRWRTDMGRMNPDAVSLQELSQDLEEYNPPQHHKDMIKMHYKISSRVAYDAPSDRVVSALESILGRSGWQVMEGEDENGMASYQDWNWEKGEYQFMGALGGLYQGDQLIFNFNENDDSELIAAAEKAAGMVTSRRTTAKVLTLPGKHIGYVCTSKMKQPIERTFKSKTAARGFVRKMAREIVGDRGGEFSYEHSPEYAVRGTEFPEPFQETRVTRARRRQASDNDSSAAIAEFLIFCDEENISSETHGSLDLYNGDDEISQDDYNTIYDFISGDLDDHIYNKAHEIYRQRTSSRRRQARDELADAGFEELRPGYYGRPLDDGRDLRIMEVDEGEYQYTLHDVDGDEIGGGVAGSYEEAIRGLEREVETIDDYRDTGGVRELSPEEESRMWGEDGSQSDWEPEETPGTEPSGSSSQGGPSFQNGETVSGTDKDGVQHSGPVIDNAFGNPVIDSGGQRVTLTTYQKQGSRRTLRRR